MMRKTIVVTLVVLLSITGATAAVHNLKMEATLTQEAPAVTYWEVSKLRDNGIGWAQANHNGGFSKQIYMWWQENTSWWEWNELKNIERVDLYVKDPPNVAKLPHSISVYGRDSEGNYTIPLYLSTAVPWESETAYGQPASALHIICDPGIVTDAIAVRYGHNSSWCELGEVDIFGDDATENDRRHLAIDATLTADSNNASYLPEKLRDGMVGYKSGELREHVGLTGAGPQYSRNYNEIKFYNGSGTYWEWDTPKRIDTIRLFMDPDYAHVRVPEAIAVWYRDQSSKNKRIVLLVGEELTSAWQPNDIIPGSVYINLDGLDIVTDYLIIDYGCYGGWARLGEVQIIGKDGEWQPVQTAETLVDARNMGFLTQCNITDAIVTFEREYSWGAFYVEDSDRTVGMCVLDPGGVVQNVQPGDRVTIIGETKPNFNGEKQIHATSVIKTGSGDVLTAVGMPNIKLAGADYMYDSGSGSGQPGVPGGTGLNTMGLYVKSWGRIVKWEQDDPDLQMIHISDGSGTDLEPNLIVLTPAYTYNDEYPVGSYVAVTGINSRTNYGGYYRAILQASSIEILAPAQ